MRQADIPLGKTLADLHQDNLNYEKEILEIVREHPKKDYTIIAFFVRPLKYEDIYEKTIRVQATLHRLVRNKKIVKIAGVDRGNIPARYRVSTP